MRRGLVVIDAQDVYRSGPLPIVFPPLTDCLAQIGHAMDSAGQAGVPIVVVQSVPADTPDPRDPDPMWALLPEVADRRRDHLLIKHLPSCFAGTDLDALLRAWGIDTLTMVGFMTHNCVDATVKDAVHRGYEVEVLSDATGSLPYANSAGAVDAVTLHTATLVVMQARFAAVATTHAWLQAIVTNTPLPRGTIIDSARDGAARFTSNDM